MPVRWCLWIYEFSQPRRYKFRDILRYDNFKFICLFDPINAMSIFYVCTLKEKGKKEKQNQNNRQHWLENFIRALGFNAVFFFFFPPFFVLLEDEMFHARAPNIENDSYNIIWKQFIKLSFIGHKKLCYALSICFH